jgi:hypothetical protein
MAISKAGIRCRPCFTIKQLTFFNPILKDPAPGKNQFPACI